LEELKANAVVSPLVLDMQLKMVVLPVLANPTMPHCKDMFADLRV